MGSLRFTPHNYIYPLLTDTHTDTHIGVDDIYIIYNTGYTGVTGYCIHPKPNQTNANTDSRNSWMLTQIVACVCRHNCLLFSLVTKL